MSRAAHSNTRRGRSQYRVFCTLKFAIQICRRAVCALIMEATRSRCDALVFPCASAPHRDKNISTFRIATSAPQVMWQISFLVTESAADGCLATTNASGAQPPETLWKKGESSAPSVFHAFLGAIMWTGPKSVRGSSLQPVARWRTGSDPIRTGRCYAHARWCVLGDVVESWMMRFCWGELSKLIIWLKFILKGWLWLTLSIFSSLTWLQ